jgi:uncharacterized protein (DUF1697 family)
LTDRIAQKATSVVECGPLVLESGRKNRSEVRRIVVLFARPFVVHAAVTLVRARPWRAAGGRSLSLTLTVKGTA